MKLMYFSMGGISPFNIGGTSTVAYNLLRNFDKLNMNVHFVFVILKKNIPKQGFKNFFKVSDNITFHPIVKENYELDYFGGGIGALKLSNLVKKVEPDIIHYNLFPSKREFLIPWIAKIRSIPQVYTYHGRYWKEVDQLYSPLLTIYFKKEFQFYRNFYDKIVVNSKDMMRHALKEGFDSSKIIIIPNGFDIEKFKKAKPCDLKGEPAILFVGRLEQIKGVDLLIEGHKKVLRELPRATLHVVGDGSLDMQLKNLVESLNINDKVIFHGFVPENVKLSYYKSADICVFPSTYEPFGIVILEAMAARKPIIASLVGGIPELVKHERNALLINPDSEEIAEAVQRLYNDPSLMREMAGNNAGDVQRYDWKEISKRYIEVYHQILEVGEVR